jgi:hypothetical protein
MKRITGIVCLLCTLSAAAQTLPEEAVGINTENPRGVLHIDAASTPATVNPSTGPVTGDQAADDVLIDASGRLGAGVAAPAAKVDLQAATPGAALRIADGTEGEGKALVSDASGAGRWIEISASVLWYAALYSGTTSSTAVIAGIYPYAPYSANTLISSTNQGSVNPTAGTITVPSKGKYRITVSAHSMGPVNFYWAISALLVNNTLRWSPSVWGTQTGWGILPSYTAILNLEANDVLRFAQDRRESFNGNTGSGVQAFMVELIQSTQ